MFANRKYEELSYPKKSENMQPHSSSSIENATPFSESSRENATPSCGTSPLVSYKEVPLQMGVWPDKRLFEKLNTCCFNREVGILDALFLIIGDDFQLTVSHSDYCSSIWYTIHSFLVLYWTDQVYFPDALQLVLQVLEKRETSAVEARARDSRARGLKLRETNMATVGGTCDTCVVKLDPKWHYLDLRNSNLISIGSLTHSPILGSIYGLNIYGCGMAKVVRILWGKLKFMFTEM